MWGGGCARRRESALGSHLWPLLGPTPVSGAPPGGFGVGEGKENVTELGDAGNAGSVLTGRLGKMGSEGSFVVFFFPLKSKGSVSRVRSFASF